MNLAAIQVELQKQKLDGWLFFDHHRRDPLAYRVLGFQPASHVTRRWYYWIPAAGEPRGLVHRIESGRLDSLPGDKIRYSSWSEQTGGRGGDYGDVFDDGRRHAASSGLGAGGQQRCGRRGQEVAPIDRPAHSSRPASWRSMWRPIVRLFFKRSSRLMNQAGCAPRCDCLRLGQASSNLTPSIDIRISTRTGGWPIW